MTVEFGALYALDGTTIPGQALRRQLQREAGTGSGVARAGDLKVTPLDTPGPGVKIAAGDDLIQCRMPGRDRETFGVPLFTSQDYLGDGGEGLPGRGSGTPGTIRRDLIIHEILDPTDGAVSYTPPEQWPEGATSKISIVPGVSTTARTVDDVPALNNVTCYALAAIDYPPSTSTIGAGQATLVDLRRLHNPKSDRVFRSADLTTLQRINGTGEEGDAFPAELTSLIGQVEIPDGMTHARTAMTIAGVRVPTGASTGQYWLQIGDNADPDRVIGPPSSFDPDATSEMYREPWIYGATVAIPAAIRGTTKSFIMKARVNATRPENQQIYIDTGGSAILDVEFFQKAI